MPAGTNTTSSAGTGASTIELMWLDVLGPQVIATAGDRGEPNPRPDDDSATPVPGVGLPGSGTGPGSRDIIGAPDRFDPDGLEGLTPDQ